MPNIFHTALASPKKFTSRAKISKRIAEYFNYCEQEDKVFTVTGLALFLGMHRTTLVTYGKDEKFADIIERAKCVIEASLDERVSSGSGTSSNQFVLRENFNWKTGGDAPNVHIDLSNSKISLTKIDINALPEEDKVSFLTGRLTAKEIEDKIANS